jgi:hypothetical protein
LDMDVNTEGRMEILAARVAKVRRWLAAFAILKVAAFCMLFVCGYIGVYIWLDHRFNFGFFGRIIALLLLVVGAVIIFYKLSRILIVQISYTNAANYIENKNSFDQQLVAAMEYYEKKTDYPYSETLAEYLVARVCDDSREFKFDSTIEKWHGYILALVVLIGFGVVGFYVQRNLAYLKTYFTRLAIPIAAIEPVSATKLESTTKDLVSEPESMLTFTAEIKGRVPENGKLVLEPMISDSNELPRREEIPVSALVREDGNPRLEASNYFEEIGKFRYRFEAGQTSSEWHNIEIREAPKIESITAEISLPAKLLNENVLKNYTEKIKDNKLELIENSTVTLSVKTTEKINEAAITGLDGMSSSEKLDGTDTFTYTFKADKDGLVGFNLTDEKGLMNKNIPNLEIKLKTDESPKFKLISPESDYLATNVASIPIEFEVSDDFGLNLVEMCFELPQQRPILINIPVEPGEKVKRITHILELEQHDLEVGDSILFYARASDITTGIIPENNSSSSNTYFIEIRPYQQFWHLMPGGGEGNTSGSVPEGLMTVLEYTRAIVKKTWTIACKQNPTEQDRSRLGSIADDLSYCSELLKTIRDDPENEFTDQHKAVLNRVLSLYEQAIGDLGRHDASAALVPEKDAYRILRKFIIELDLQYNPPSSGQSAQEEKPDKVTLQESPEFTGFEQERIEAEMQKVQRNIEQLKRQQKQLKTDFENFLEQKEKVQRKSQIDTVENQTGKESSGQKLQEDSDGSKSQDTSRQKSQGEADSQSSGGSSGKSQEASQNQSSTDGQDKSSGQSYSVEKQTGSSKDGSEDKEAIARKQQSDSGGERGSKKEIDSPEGQSDSDQKSNGDSEDFAGSREGQMKKSDSASQSDGPTEGGSDKQVDGQDKGETASSGESTEISGDAKSGQSQRDYSGDMRDSINEDARLRMLQARQKALQEKVSQLKQDLEKMPESENAATAKASQQAQKHLDQAIEKMEQFQDKMNEVRYDTQSDTRNATDAMELMDSAERDLASAENALEPGTMMSEGQELAKKAQEMAEQLSQDAEALDESLTALEREEMLARLKAAEHLLESMTGASWATIRKSDGQTGGGRVLTKDATSAADTAREISRQFWSIALNAQERMEQPIEEKPSDVRFYELENEFFENAAKYNQGAGQK